MKKILDIGCGNKKREGAVGIDINTRTKADIICDLNKFFYPFKDSFFDEVYMEDVIEHLDDVIKVMEEIHRISKNNALIKIIVPYFRSKWAYIDPTHKHFFTTESFAYFDPDNIISKVYPYSTAKFKVKRIVFNENIERGKIISLYTKIANLIPSKYETYLSHLFPLDSLTYYLKTIK